MGGRDYSKLLGRWRKERAERASRSDELRRQLLDSGVPVLRAYGVRDAWLFGSVSEGRVGPGSDIDLLVIPVAAEDYWSLRRDLEEAVGCPLDLYTQDDDPVFVRKIIERGEPIGEIQP